MYGASLTFDERVDDEEICLAMQTLQVTESFNHVAFIVLLVIGTTGRCTRSLRCGSYFQA